MLQMYVGDLLIVGVTRANVEKLTAHQPMLIRLAKPATAVCLVFGETKPAILTQVEQEMQIEIADVLKAAAAADPL
jgi:hypothetical protein